MKLTLVMVAGWGVGARIWESFLPYLEPYYQVICLKQHLAFLPAAVINQVPTQSHWLGWSLGGSLALQAYGYFPDKFKSLCLLAHNPHFIATKEWPGIASENLKAMLAAVQQEPRMALKKFYATLFAPKSEYRHFIREISLDPLPEPAALVNGLLLLQNLDLRQQLQELTIPLLQLFAEYDPLIPQKLMELYPQGQVIAGSCHPLFLTHPKQVVEAMLTFHRSTIYAAI